MINFEQYDRENPQIWKAFVKFARHAKSKGFKSYSSKGIFELIRWHSKARGNDDYKINNTYTPDYARKMVKEFPEYQGFFKERKLKALRKEESVSFRVRETQTDEFISVTLNSQQVAIYNAISVLEKNIKGSVSTLRIINYLNTNTQRTWGMEEIEKGIKEMNSKITLIYNFTSHFWLAKLDWEKRVYILEKAA